MKSRRIRLNWLWPLCAALLAASMSSCTSALQRRAASKESATGALATYRVGEHLGRRVVDELVHFDFDVVTGAATLALSDERGVALPAQATGLTRKGAHLQGRVWTLLSLEPRSTKQLTLRAQGAPAASVSHAAPDAVSIDDEGGRLVLRNDRVAVAVPRWAGPVPQSSALTALPAPFEAVRIKAGGWLGGARWVNAGRALMVREARTEVLERGPVRAVIAQRLTFSDGHFYTATLTLAARQDVVLIVEDSDVNEPRAALQLSMQDGLAADHVYWHSQWNSTERPGSWALYDTDVGFDRERVICKMRPWSFGWLPDIAEWAGFYRKGYEPLVGVLMMRPSRWSPEGWQGFDRTEVPVTARKGGGIDLSFSLAAGKVMLPNGSEAERPLHREWALTAGSVTEHVVNDGTKAKLRQQLVRYGEFPLDELKDYGFEFASPPPGEAAPRLIFKRDVVARVRAQASTEPAVQAQLQRALRHIEACGGLATTLDKEGPEAFFTRYVFHQLQHSLPTAYLASSDPQYGRFMAAAVKGLARKVVTTFLDEPAKPAVGAYGPWFTETVTRLLLHYDLIADSGLLSPQEEVEVRAVLVFAAHVLAHPDYWNLSRGLNSGNPNMTSMILLPRGLLGLALPGHPESAAWLHDAETELANELADWVSDGGAWVESPFYQVSSLDGMFLFAQALRNVTGRDAFAKPRFKETLDYFGSILTPPDRRFPPQKKADAPSPMVVPSVGHSFAGTTTPFNGWMAAVTADTDPAFSARQQFFWERQGYPYEIAYRAAGLVPAVTDPTLRASAPPELSRAFPGLGSVLRTSWTDPEASYLLYRTGPNGHHFDDDQGSFVYYAKGAPLCVDWGNLYQPLLRSESFYHNRVSFDKSDSPRHFGTLGKLLALHSLPTTLDYTHGETAGGGNQRSFRHILFVKSGDPLGANYVLMRDLTRENVPGESFYWNLWCLSRGIEIQEDSVHFPGQYGVDLDVHIVSPVAPQIERDHWSWKQPVYIWREFSEEQYAMRVAKVGNAEDFLMLLHPRAEGQREARVQALSNSAGVRIVHEEGTDYVLLSPGAGAVLERDDALLRGEIAFARKYRNGVVRLAVVQGAQASARLGNLTLASAGPTAIERRQNTIAGESSGAAHRATITLAPGARVKRAALDGRPVVAVLQERTMTLEMPAGTHTFEVVLE